MSLFSNPFFDEKHQSGEPPRPEDHPSDIIISPDTRRDNRLPPGQSRTRKWPVLDATGPPQIDLANWRLEVFGFVENPISLSLPELMALPQVKVFSDFHCVTRWSRLGNLWEGVATRAIADIVHLKPEAAFVLAHAYDNGWTTNMPLENFLAKDALLTHTHDGKPISEDHGGPVRLIIPQLYAWKSAKWLRGIEFLNADKTGYWEHGGYHMLGDPWREQRFRWD
jgi:DMSO/TMAO reductase YedYZ molybdopterin-dependent catalytic subunit